MRAAKGAGALAFVGMRGGLFGRKEVDADFIVYGVTCDYAVKRHRVWNVDDGYWYYEYTFIKTRRPPQPSDLPAGTCWRPR